MSHDGNDLTLSGRYPASGRDGWESNPPKRFWRPPRQPWNIRPYMSPLGHIVERCAGSYAQPELHRGIKGKYQLPKMSCFYRPQLIYSWSEDASPETLPAMVQTAGLEPAHTSWRGALPTELRLHTPGIRRGQEERKDGWKE